MKEVTYEEWQENPTPRTMWVWDNSYSNKEQRKVIYIIDKGTRFPVVTIDEYDSVVVFKHCAEIEEPKTRRMTNQELSWWLMDGMREGEHREWKYKGTGVVKCYIYYLENEGSTPIREDILIRENGGEWHKPLVEVEE